MVKHMKSQQVFDVDTGAYQLKQDDNDSDWNDIVYPQNYRAKTQFQVTPR